MSFSTNKMRNIIFIYLLLNLHHVCGQPSELTLTDYVYYDQWVNWKDAQMSCRDKHTDLVTIRNNKDSLVMYNFPGWIGLYQDLSTDQWKWSRGDEIPTYLNWADSEPQDNCYCAYKATDVKWRSERCDFLFTYMCIDEKLVLVNENKTWDEALEHCRSLNDADSVNPVIKFWKHNYDLATLITADDHDLARDRAQEATTDEVWTGLRFLYDEWVWIGGEPVQYQDLSSCPAVRCGVLEKNTNTSYGLRDCSQRKNFFCYKKL